MAEKFYKLPEVAFYLDELIILNVSRTRNNIDDFCNTVSRLVEETFIPVSVGGGIRTLDDAEKLFNCGADKIVLNTSLYKDEQLVFELVKKYGSQSIVASLDYKLTDQFTEEIFINCGEDKIEIELDEYLKRIKRMNIGEIYLNSIERDGTGFGYDFSLVEKIGTALNVPIIIAGGAGNEKHFSEALQYKKISAVATANLFNFIGDGLPNARRFLINSGENVANWNVNK